MSTKPKTLDVTIMGRVYKVACEEGEREALLSAVAYLDKKMSEIKGSGKIASAERIAVMAALNISHEMLSSRGSPTGFDSDSMKGRMIAMQVMLDEVLASQEKLL